MSHVHRARLPNAGRHSEERPHPMSRAETLVTTDWANENLNTHGLVFVEVDEDTSAYDGGHVPDAVKISWKDDLRDTVRYDFIDKDGLEKLFSEKGISNDDTDRAVRRQQQLVRRVRVLVLQAVRPRERQADRRRPQEVGAGRAAADHARSPSDRRPSTAPRTPTCRSARTATTPSRRSARRTWSTSGRPVSSPANWVPPRTCPRRTRSVAATSRLRSTSPGRRLRTRTALSSPIRN